MFARGVFVLLDLQRNLFVAGFIHHRSPNPQCGSCYDPLVYFDVDLLIDIFNVCAGCETEKEFSPTKTESPFLLVHILCYFLYE